jgi:hypothetical protein
MPVGCDSGNDRPRIVQALYYYEIEIMTVQERYLDLCCHSMAHNVCTYLECLTEPRGQKLTRRYLGVAPSMIACPHIYLPGYSSTYLHSAIKPRIGLTDGLPEAVKITCRGDMHASARVLLTEFMHVIFIHARQVSTKLQLAQFLRHNIRDPSPPHLPYEMI